MHDKQTSKVLVVYFQSNYIEGVFILTFHAFKQIYFQVKLNIFSSWQFLTWKLEKLIQAPTWQFFI